MNTTTPRNPPSSGSGTVPGSPSDAAATLVAPTVMQQEWISLLKRGPVEGETRRTGADSLRDGVPATVAVPVDDPFGRGCQRRVLNPGSCSSGLNLLSPAGPEAVGGVPRTIAMPVEDAPPRRVLNPGSCASGLDLLSPAGLDSAGSLASLYRQTLRASSGASAMNVLFGASQRRRMLNPGSCSASRNLLSLAGLESAGSLASRYRETLRASSGASAMSVLFGASQRYVPCVDGARLRPSSQDSRRNADWDIFQ